MADVLTELLDRWVYDIERPLWSLVDGRKEDLASDEEFTRTEAEREISEALNWLCPPLEPVSREERMRVIEAALDGAGLPAAQRRSLAMRASRSSQDKPGRPRIEGRTAIRALMLRCITYKTWGEIAFEIKGRCKHVCMECGDTERPVARVGQKPRCPKCKSTIRPEGKRQEVCARCVDALCDLVTQLEKFLRMKGIYPTLPRRKVLDEMSLEEIERL